MRLLATLFLLCILVACASPAATPLPPTSVPSTSTPASIATRATLTGQWLGAATRPNGSNASLAVDFESATVNLEPLTKTWPMKVTQTGDAVTFSSEGQSNEPFQQIQFSGTLVNGVLQGELNWDGKTSAITFTPLAVVDAMTFAKYEGLYRFESGRALSVIVSPEYSSGGLYFFSQTLMLTDFESGALRALYPLDDYTFAVGVLRVVGAPFAGRVQFVTDAAGRATGLMWWDGLNDVTPSATSGQFAQRVEYTREEIEFTSDDGTKLAGLLSLPPANGPVPAFMALHGSEPGTRANFGAKVMAHYMLSQGLAILNYDKRGVGDSKGIYQEAASASNLQHHAEDAIAGVTYLAARPEIDDTHIGLIGFSQAGWVIPLAASQSEAITHFVILSGPAESTLQEDIFSSYTNDGDSATTYDDASITQRLRETNPGGFDPLPILAELKQPGLWLWGSVDKSVPVTFSAENLQALIDAGKTNYAFHIFPMGDHNLNESPQGLFAEIPYSPRVLFYTELAQWLKINMFKEQ